MRQRRQTNPELETESVGSESERCEFRKERRVTLNLNGLDSAKGRKSVLFSKNPATESDQQRSSAVIKDDTGNGSSRPTSSRHRVSIVLSPRNSTIQQRDSISSPQPQLPLLEARRRRAVSAGPVGRTKPTETSTDNGHSPQRKSMSRSRPFSRESAVAAVMKENDPGDVQSPRLRRRSRRVERLKLRTKTAQSDDSSDSDDCSPRTSTRSGASSVPVTPSPATEALQQAWSQFQTHVRLIDDSTDRIARQPRKTFGSSDTFQNVMVDLYGNTEYGNSKGFTKLSARIGHVATFASKFIGRVKALKALRGDSFDEEFDSDEEYEVYQPSRETIENAKRGWKILRQCVQDMAAEKRMSQSTLTWDMLRHTLRGISNMEKARLDLYQRYGIIPMIRSDGTVVQENTMLSERARQALANKAERTGNTQPVIARSRISSASTARSPTKKVYKPIDGFTSRFVRPQTTPS